MGLFKRLLDPGNFIWDKPETDLERAQREQLELSRQQWEQQWNMYKEHFAPYEIEMVSAQRQALPEYVRQSTEGIDVSRRMDEAGNEVRIQMGVGEGSRRRELSRFGIDPTSSQYGNAANIAAIETSKGVAGARTMAKRQAESEKYGRLASILNKQNPDPLNRGANYASLASRLVESARQSEGPSKQSRILGLAGGVIGGIYGGPGGAAAGYGIGSSIGNS